MKEFRSLEHIIRNIVEGKEDRNTDIRRKVANVGRPEDNVKDETSKLAKQGEIKTKIVDEGLNPEDGAKIEPKSEVGDDKKKKPEDKSDSDAGEIKGGKTEVITDPKTNDIYHPGPDSTGGENDAKKTKKEAMKKAGVKEEAMLKSDNTFGLPADLIAAVTEALKGGQKKLDVAEPKGKLDAKDFKKLRGEKVEEEAIEEGDMGNKAKKNAAVTAIGAANKDEKHLTTKGTGIRGSVADKIRGREVTSGKNRMEETDPGFSAEELARIEEIAKSFLEESSDKAVKKSEPMAPSNVSSPLRGPKQDYSGVNDKNSNADYTISDEKKMKEEADPQMTQMKNQMQAKKQQIEKQIMAKKMAVMQAKAAKQISKIKEDSVDEASTPKQKDATSAYFAKGREYLKLKRAKEKAAKQPPMSKDDLRKMAADAMKNTAAMQKEEIEQIDELSPATLNSYKSKAAGSEKALTDKSSTLSVPAKERNAAAVKANQRRQGMNLAAKKIGEEVEQIDEVSSALLHRAFQKAKKNAGWLMPGDKGKGDKAWNRVKKFRDAGVAKEKQEKAAKQKTNEEVVDEAMSPKQKQFSNRVKTMPGKKGNVTGATSNFEAPLHKVHATVSKNGGPKEVVKHEIQAKDKHDAIFNIQMHHHKAGHKVHDTKYKGTVKEEIELDEAQRGRPKKNPTAEDPGSENIIMQLRKVITLRGQEPVKFADGRSVKLSPAAAHSALAKYDNLKTTGEKHSFSMRLHKSLDSMRDAIMGKAEPSKPKVSLAGKITGNQKD